MLFFQNKPDDIGSETGSETGSESMLIDTSVVDPPQNDSTSHSPDNACRENVVRVEESILEDDDAASDASVDLLAATQVSLFLNLFHRHLWRSMVEWL
jgi:hypothetical protein